jgi:cobalt/nickel transport protein
MEKKHMIMFLAVVILFAIPLILGGNFEGADISGGSALEKIGVKPWFKPIWEPPSGEVETGFFALQAAIGSLIVGYFFGYYTGKQKRDEKN